ncbi:MAG: 4-oxalocrotonate tautomerase [Pseudomonadota bacterium]
MPLIDIHVMEGVSSAEEKRRMIVETATGFGRVAATAMAANTSARVHEVPSGSWGGIDGVWTTERALALKGDS